MKKIAKKTAAIVLAAGSGGRMGSSQKKQYMELEGKPLIYYALKAFEESFVEEVVLVVPKEDIDYCAKEIVARYGFTKVRSIVAGGAERYLSVSEGLQALSNACHPELTPACHPERSEGSSLLFIHDGARPFVTQDMLRDLYDAALETGAAVAAMPVKNTIKVADAEAFVIDTPDRATLWEIQTPQVFEFELIKNCYADYITRLTNSIDLPPGGKVAPKATDEGCSVLSTPTDDAQLIERYSDVRVKLVKTSYSNLKITTPEDLIIAERFTACGISARGRREAGSALR